MPEQCSAILTGNFHKRHRRYLEPFDDQYGHERNIDLYFYARCRTMCNVHNFGYKCNNSTDSQLRGDRTALPEQCSAILTGNFHERHRRHLEPGYN